MDNRSKARELRKSGMTLQQIGDRLGITKQGAWAFLDYESKEGRRKRWTQEELSELTPKVIAWRRLGISWRGIASRLGANLQTTTQTFRASVPGVPAVRGGDGGQLRKRRVGRPQRWTQEEISRLLPKVIAWRCLGISWLVIAVRLNAAAETTTRTFKDSGVVEPRGKGAPRKFTERKISRLTPLVSRWRCEGATWKEISQRLGAGLHTTRRAFDNPWRAE